MKVMASSILYYGRDYSSTQFLNQRDDIHSILQVLRPYGLGESLSADDDQSALRIEMVNGGRYVRGITVLRTLPMACLVLNPPVMLHELMHCQKRRLHLTL